jgi:hypothetical protein
MAASVVLFSGCRGEAGPAATATTTTLPDAVGDWRATGPAEVWDTETIFDYIDGHAEVYLAYGMRGCTSRRYAGPAGEPDIVADVFELVSPADAFGVFTHDRDGDPVDVGNDARFRYGWLSAWRGAHFVSVTAEADTERSRDAVFEIGATIAASITEPGTRPDIVDALPAEDLEPESVRYLHHPLILNTHVWLGLDNPFGLDADTPAALGHYSMDGNEAFVLIVDYPDPQRARTVVASSMPMTAAAGDPVETETGWVAWAPMDETRTAFVLQGSSREAAETLIRNVMTGG